jgi:3',5'-cyclic AMP phosphodiesterase CpdA
VVSAPRPEFDPLPPRQSWEEPPPDGWASHLGGIGLETLGIAGALAAAVGVWRTVNYAHELGARPEAVGSARVMTILVWLLAGFLAAALVVLIRKRLGGLALLGAMLTDHGRVARFRGRPPIWLDHPPDARLRIAHLSDLHVTEGARVRLVEQARPGGTGILPSLLATPAIASADLVLVTGDVTDRGTAQSWEQFLTLVRTAGIVDRTVIVPGNHDLCLVDPWGGLRDPDGHWRRNDRFGIVQLANVLKFCEAFASTGGGRLGQVLQAGEIQHYADAFLAVDRDVRPLMTELPNLPVPKTRIGRGFFARRRLARAYEARVAAARSRLLGLFPVAVPIPGKDAVLFVLNSCTPISRHPATNGLGWVGRQQYRRLDRLARAFSNSTKLVALHHHVVRRSEELAGDLVSRFVAKFAVLGDARPLVRFCHAQGIRAVFNGHRHLSYELRLPGGTVLLAAPSSTLGDELAHDPRPQFECYDIAPAIDEPTVGIHREVVVARQQLRTSLS